MLAATLTKPEAIQYPAWASPKIDGIRCIVFGGVAYSRSLKPIRNKFVQEWVASKRWALDGFDGELVVGSPTDPNCMQNTTSGVMRAEGHPDFTFYVFDYVAAAERTDVRRYLLELAFQYIPELQDPRVRLLEQVEILDADELANVEAGHLAEGYEGVMLRRIHSVYKYGRATERSGELVKVKRFTDSEAIVVGFVEEMHNTNEATRDAFGRTERSTAKAGLVGKGTLGALECITPDGVRFQIGSGFSADQRAEFWRTREALRGLIVSYRHFDHGTVTAPRHPVFKAFRDPEDIS